MGETAWAARARRAAGGLCPLCGTRLDWDTPASVDAHVRSHSPEALADTAANGGTDCDLGGVAGG